MGQRHFTEVFLCIMVHSASFMDHPLEYA